MKTKILIILIVVIIIAVGGVGYYFYKTLKYSSPEKTYSLYIKAMEKGGVEAYLECFTEESQEMLRSGVVLERLTPERLKTVFEFYKEAKFQVTEKTSDTAVMASETVEAGVLIFKKEKGNWKVDLGEIFIQPQRDATEEGLTETEELSEKEKKEEAKKLISEALSKIEKIKIEEDPQKLQLLIGEVIDFGKKAVELDPGNPEILFQMGNIYFEIKEIVSGVDVWAKYYYEKALKLDPNNPVYQEKLREI